MPAQEHLLVLGPSLWAPAVPFLPSVRGKWGTKCLGRSWVADTWMRGCQVRWKCTTNVCCHGIWGVPQSTVIHCSCFTGLLWAVSGSGVCGTNNKFNFTFSYSLILMFFSSSWCPFLLFQVSRSLASSEKSQITLLVYNGPHFSPTQMGCDFLTGKG